jgi:hypothetical protein
MSGGGVLYSSSQFRGKTEGVFDNRFSTFNSFHEEILYVIKNQLLCPFTFSSSVNIH